MIPIPHWFLPDAPAIARRALFLMSLGAILFGVIWLVMPFV